MTNIDKDTANWRLFGGSALLVGGLLWLIGAILKLAGVAGADAWLVAIGILLAGIAAFFVAFGQTGSNGAVGASALGKVGLVAFGLGWVVLAGASLFVLFGALASVPDVLRWVVAALVVIGGLIGAFIINGRGVARGLAKWVLFLPVLWAIVYFLQELGVFTLGAWVGAVLAALLAITGLLYLLNRKDVG